VASETEVTSFGKVSGTELTSGQIRGTLAGVDVVVVVVVAVEGVVGATAGLVSGAFGCSGVAKNSTGEVRATLVAIVVAVDESFACLVLGTFCSGEVVSFGLWGRALVFLSEGWGGLLGLGD
jgi:hypothetical protein